MIGIYKITSPTGKVYIGQSKNITKRFNQYRLLHCKGQKILYNSFLKHGFEKHEFEVLEECEITNLNNKERHYQDLYSVLSKNGMNCTLVKSNDKPYVVSYETRIKIKQKAIGRKMSDDQKLKISIGNLGKKRTKEAILKFSKRYISNETRSRISNSKKGSVASQHTKNKMSISQTGRTHSEKTKLKMSISAKNSEYSIQRRKVILDLMTGIFYIGVEEASQAYNIRKSVLKCYLNGKSKNKTNLIYV